MPCIGGEDVYEGIRSPAVHLPRTMGDLISVATRFPNAIFWGGGTYIMSRPGYYINGKAQDIIYTGRIAELKRINRTDRYLEIGSAVTFEQLLSVGRQALPPLLHKTIESSASKIVRSQMSVGGSLATKGIRFSLSAALSALQAEAEVKTCMGIRTTTRWVEVGRLYDRQGNYILKSNEFITRIRLAFDKENFSYFIRTGKPIIDPSDSVTLAFACFYNQSVITRFNMCIIFPSSLFLVPQEVDISMQGALLPLSTQQIERVVKSVTEQINSEISIDVLPIQVERAKRFIESALHELNSTSLT